MTKPTIRTNTAMTIKIPKPIPALNIPPMASQELKNVPIKINTNTGK